MTDQLGETVEEYAARQGVSRRTVLRWIQRGYLQAIRRGYGPTSPYIVLGERAARQPPPISPATPVRREPRYVPDPAADQRPAAPLPLTDEERDAIQNLPYQLTDAEITAWLSRRRQG